jgi:hypothetical protein
MNFSIEAPDIFVRCIPLANAGTTRADTPIPSSSKALLWFLLFAQSGVICAQIRVSRRALGREAAARILYFVLPIKMLRRSLKL